MDWVNRIARGVGCMETTPLTHEQIQAEYDRVEKEYNDLLGKSNRFAVWLARVMFRLWKKQHRVVVQKV
jgi:hypothetical protein